MTSAVQGTTSTPTQAATSSVNLAKNFSSFLTLLTTQLQNQDPLKPLDSNEFTSQLVQFSQVEQSINTNKTLESMLAMLQGKTTTDSIGYIGKQIEVDSATNAYSGDPLTWRYSLDGSASAAQVAVVDAKGHVVRTLAASTAAGAHELTWDGKDASGNAVAAGNYTLKVTAVDGSGKAVTSTIGSIATVTGVEASGSALSLVTKSGTVAIDKVKGIYAPAAS
ncbi:flagellar hook assembly protein FlgD [Oleomonas cavernae]|nr:flagellar hook capping FlgD N-terminal domain-containing protein [Oleomonas cavernae]